MAKSLLQFLVPLMVWILPSVNGAGQQRALVEERAAESLKQKRVRTLVELLASKNEAPTEKRNYLNVLQDYDKQAQVVVYLAIQQLLAEGSDAFDLLIEHLDDDRYSHSYESIQGQFNRTVGAVCHDILVRAVQ